MHSDGLLAEVTTPPNLAGFGTEEYLVPSQNAIHAIVVAADPREPDMSILRVRFDPSMNRLEQPILRLNKACMQKANDC